jgi:type IV pilus biogenesis protein CpaD/CtpE
LNAFNDLPVTAPKRLKRLDAETTLELWRRADEAHSRERDMMLWGHTAEAMISVEIPVVSGDINTPMNAMGLWLDQMRIEPAHFSWSEGNDGAVVRVQFKIAQDAVAFAEHFLGQALGPKENPRR